MTLRLHLWWYNTAIRFVNLRVLIDRAIIYEKFLCQWIERYFPWFFNSIMHLWTSKEQNLALRLLSTRSWCEKSASKDQRTAKQDYQDHSQRFSFLLLIPAIVAERDFAPQWSKDVSDESIENRKQNAATKGKQTCLGHTSLLCVALDNVRSHCSLQWSFYEPELNRKSAW